MIINPSEQVANAAWVSEISWCRLYQPRGPVCMPSSGKTLHTSSSRTSLDPECSQRYTSSGFHTHAPPCATMAQNGAERMMLRQPRA